MTVAEMIKTAVEIGLSNSMLIAFIWYFFQQDKRRDAKMDERDRNRDKQFDDMFTSFRERENILVAEGARREELLRSEADKREKLLRQEAEKRENMLMKTIDGFSQTMKEISTAMNDIKNSYVHMEHKVTGIEDKLERLRTRPLPAADEGRVCRADG